MAPQPHAKFHSHWRRKHGERAKALLDGMEPSEAKRALASLPSDLALVCGDCDDDAEDLE